MIKGTTDTGFAYEIEEERLYNYEFVETLEEVESNPIALVKAVKLLLGDEQTERLKDHVRSENGIVSTVKMTNELENIFLKQAETKNS